MEVPGLGIKGQGKVVAIKVSLFAAIQEQLGLKLEPQKGPVEVTVIDRAELPAEN